jgi:hypothetical protein
LILRNHTVRLYVAAATLLAFFVLWTSIAAKPWATAKRPAADPRLVALTVREHRLRAEALAVKRVVAHRWKLYERRLRARQGAIAAAEQRHSQQVAAAQLAAQRIAAARSVASRTVAVSSVSSAPAASSSSTPVQRVVTLPPRVQIVTLPPVTSSTSSRP